MITKPLVNIGRYALWLSPVVIVVVGFFAAIPWLKQQNDSFVLLLSAAVSIFVMGYALFDFAQAAAAPGRSADRQPRIR